jgi:hypothetical protein
MGSVLKFETKRLAIEFLDSVDWLKSYGSSWSHRHMYILSYGEYSSPDYRPRRYGDGWGIHRETYYYSGTFNVPKSGRVDVM